MKTKIGIVFMSVLATVLATVSPAGLSAADVFVKPLSQIGDVDTETVKNMKGFWMIEGSKYLFEYTDSYACRIHGVKYFFFKRNRNHTRIPFVFTVVKSKETGRLYFARGEYKNGQLVGSTSRIVFKGKDRMVVYKSNTLKKVFYKARRVTLDEETKHAKNNSKKTRK